MEWFLRVAAALVLAALPLLPAHGKRSPYADKWGEIKTPFDEAAAEAALEPGNSRLSGRTFAKLGFLSKKYGAERLVFLLPLVPYYEEWYARFRRNPAVGLDYLDKRAAQYHARALTDEEGRFLFENLKPGRYLLYSTVGYTIKSEWREVVGVARGYNVFGHLISTVPIYGERHVDTIPLTHHILRIVEIKTDGEHVDLGDVR